MSTMPTPSRFPTRHFLTPASIIWYAKLTRRSQVRSELNSVI
jgi:hypothetical protein